MICFYMGRYPVEGSGPDCKSGVNDSVGSIPTRPTSGAMSSAFNGQGDDIKERDVPQSGCKHRG